MFFVGCQLDKGLWEKCFIFCYPVNFYYLTYFFVKVSNSFDIPFWINLKFFFNFIEKMGVCMGACAKDVRRSAEIVAKEQD